MPGGFTQGVQYKETLTGIRGKAPMNTENTRITQPTSVEKDPVCGMTVDPARAKATHEHSGKKYYFCCAGCMEKFRAEPAKYLAPKTLVGIAPMSSRPVDRKSTRLNSSHR